jgi:hypothetical protein
MKEHSLLEGFQNSPNMFLWLEQHVDEDEYGALVE